MIAPRVSNSQPPLFVPWHCGSAGRGVRVIAFANAVGWR
jgi:hypothetical protein